MKQTSNIHCIFTYLWSKQVLNLIILINLMIAARELTFGKMAFWRFTTGQIIYQVNGSKVVCCAMWICIFCLSPSKYKCILVKETFLLIMYTQNVFITAGIMQVVLLKVQFQLIQQWLSVPGLPPWIMWQLFSTRPRVGSAF